MTPMDRRSFLASITAASAMLAGCSRVQSSSGRRHRLLVFTKSAGYEHAVIKRGPGDAPSLVERTLTTMAAERGFDVHCTKDGRIFSSSTFPDFDAYFFFTTGTLTTVGTDGHPAMSDAGKTALLESVRSGKGFVGAHSAADTFHTQPDTPDRANRFVTHYPNVDPYILMLGGEFMRHGRQQAGRLVMVDPSFPGMERFGRETVSRMGEWYSLKEFDPQMHVVQVLDTAGMVDKDYARGPFPVTWARRHGRGRVFYTALGHRDEEWSDPAMLGLIGGALSWAFGDVDASLEPNLASAAPRAGELPPR